MEVSPEVRKFLDDFGSSSQHLRDLGVEGSRKQSRAWERQFAWDPKVDVVTRDEDVRVSGGNVPVRIYTPKGVSQRGLPVLMWIHGGGWALGWVDSLDTDSLCRYLCARIGSLVVSVGYRLAPEYKFPVPLEDCYEALKWTAQNAVRLGGDPRRIAVAGESAGGNLVAALALVARDRGGPAIAFQVPINPITNHDTSTETYREYGKGYSLDTEDMVWFWEQYIGRKEDADNPYASPLLAKSLKGLPPALVMTAELDPLRDEGEAYAERLKSDGVPTKLIRVKGKPHGFIGLPFGTKDREELVWQLRHVFRGEWNPAV